MPMRPGMYFQTADISARARTSADHCSDDVVPPSHRRLHLLLVDRVHGLERLLRVRITRRGARLEIGQRVLSLHITILGPREKSIDVIAGGRALHRSPRDLNSFVHLGTMLRSHRRHALHVLLSALG